MNSSKERMETILGLREVSQHRLDDHYMNMPHRFNNTLSLSSNDPRSSKVEDSSLHDMHLQRQITPTKSQIHRSQMIEEIMKCAIFFPSAI